MRSGRLLLLAVALGCRRDPPPSAPAPRAALPTPATEAAIDPTLSVIEAEGTVWRTSAEGKRARAGAAVALAVGDRLTADEHSRAVVRLRDGRELVLQPGARLLVKSASRERLEVELEEGQILSRGGRAAGAPSVELTLLTPLGITRVPAESGEAKIGVSGGDVQIDVGVGEIAFLDRTGREVTARANQRIEVNLGGLQLLPGKAGTTRAPADVVLPTQRGLRVYADHLKEVTLSWPAQLGEAEVEVARDPEFRQLLPVERSSAWQATVAAPRRGELHWRVKSGAAAPLYGQARFQPDPRRSLLDLRHPENVVDDKGQVTTVYFQGARPALTFTFTAVPGADRYRLRVYRPDALDAPLFEREVRETRCAVAADTLGEGKYLWHAQALDRHGRELGGGRLNKLSIAYDNSLTTLAIASPRPGERLGGKDMKVSGVAPLGSRLYLNGTPVPVDDKGRFEMRAPGARAVIFRLVGKNGAESYWVRGLRQRS
jgi:hypothetical protein